MATTLRASCGSALLSPSSTLLLLLLLSALVVCRVDGARRLAGRDAYWRTRDSAAAMEKAAAGERRPPPLVIVVDLGMPGATHAARGRAPPDQQTLLTDVVGKVAQMLGLTVNELAVLDYVYPSDDAVAAAAASASSETLVTVKLRVDSPRSVSQRLHALRQQLRRAGLPVTAVHFTDEANAASVGGGAAAAAAAASSSSSYWLRRLAFLALIGFAAGVVYRRYERRKMRRAAHHNV